MGLLAALSPEAREELEALIDSRVQAALALRDREPAKEWLTVREAAAYWGVSERALHMRIRRGRVPAEGVKHVGRRVYVSRRVLDRTLEAES